MSLLPVWFKGLSPELVKKAELELNETPEVKAKALAELKKLISAQKNLHSRTDDSFLLRFLRTKKFDARKAFKVLCNYYNFKAKHDGVFTNLKPSEVKKALDMDNMFYSPYRVSDGSHIAILRMGAYDPNIATAEELVATILVCAELIIELDATQICGGILIIDLQGAGFHQYKMFVTFQFFKFVINALQECWPERMKGIHFVNEPYALYAMFQMVKPFIKKKLMDRLHLHGNDLESLHKLVPKSLLPQELGGYLGPMDGKQFKESILSQEDVIVESNKYGILEKKK